MITQDQSEVVAFLQGVREREAGEAVEVVETHISLVFLAGDRVHKLKRAVRLPYADFSTPQLRLEACEKEVRLNSSTAPRLYLGVRRITRDADGSLAFDGEGTLVDAVVEMVRFDQEHLFDRMATAGKLTPELMNEVAGAIVAFHRQAPVVHAGGGADNMRAVLDVNEAGFATSHVFAYDEVERFNARFRDAVEAHAALLDTREARGRVRRCHGDLHLRNICLFDGRPRLFDCIEFNDAIATVDVLYDLAFLLMDLWHRGLEGLANLVTNRYLDAADDDDGFVLLPFFMAVRAAVRAHVTATQAEESGDASHGLAEEARAYFDLALRLLEPVGPRLIALCGLSGSGKTTVAEALAPYVGAPPGARILESDRVRKAMFAVPPETRLGEEAYAPEVSEKVYRTLPERARPLLAAGGSVVVGAVFDRLEHRALIEQAARQSEVPFTGVWLETDPETLRQRVGGRKGGASDATLAVLERQLERDVGEIVWKRIDAGRDPAAIVDDILAETRTREAPT